MRRSAIAVNLAVILLLLTMADCLPAGEKSKLQWYSFEKGLAEAKKSNKKLLVDVYTDWCGWCKRMDAETYADQNVAAYLQKNYVVVKLNAESQTEHMFQGSRYSEQEIAGGFGVTGYPTTLFLTPDGQTITAVPGYADAVKFKTILSYIAEDHYKTTKFGDYSEKK